jgi:hypothetical protein
MYQCIKLHVYINESNDMYVLLIMNPTISICIVKVFKFYLCVTLQCGCFGIVPNLL